MIGPGRFEWNSAQKQFQYLPVQFLYMLPWLHTIHAESESVSFLLHFIFFVHSCLVIKVWLCVTTWQNGIDESGRSHTASIPYPTMYHFWTEMPMLNRCPKLGVYCGIWDRYIVGCLRVDYWLQFFMVGELIAQKVPGRNIKNLMALNWTDSETDVIWTLLHGFIRKWFTFHAFDTEIDTMYSTPTDIDTVDTDWYWHGDWYKVYQ